MYETTLYRHYDKDNKLLYVGISNTPMQRLAGHIATYPWWTNVAFIRLEHFSTRAQAMIAEARAVKNENPVYNIMLNDLNPKHKHLDDLNTKPVKYRIIL